MYGSLDISTSGMVAQRTRMAAIASNIANSQTMVQTPSGFEPYRRRIPIMSPGDPASGGSAGSLGVHVSEIALDQTDFRRVYRPESPYADKDGIVKLPNISTATEQMHAMEASRAYEANVVAAETTKSMMAQALRLLA